ncbi:uncharacterized protein LOC110446948 [Mizuhopecten yessoensis]|uniref:uncharacterized protein LOC110446948 n=1 Tax=Mizuhopecten yessoensis TaxID=6573 RepID=UPI000B45DE3B|nr:uncharacterized protein LOC110446948 [Mizuhopecten yessoensis]
MTEIDEEIDVKNRVMIEKKLGSEQDGTKKEIPTGWSDRLGLTHSSPVRASRPSPLPTLALPRRDAANRSIEQSSCRHIPEGTSAYPMSTAKFLKKVMTMLANIRVELREQREGKEMAISDLQTIPFQTRSIDELQRIDDTLKSPEDCLKMTMALACVGGSSINENARKILQKCCSTYYAMHRNYSRNSHVCSLEVCPRQDRRWWKEEG